MSKNRKATSNASHTSMHKRRLEASPVESNPPMQTQRIRVPAKKKKHTYEDEITFTQLVDYSSSPAKAPTDDEDELPTSILAHETRMGTRVRTPSSKAVYMKQAASAAVSSSKLQGASARERPDSPTYGESDYDESGVTFSRDDFRNTHIASLAGSIHDEEQRSTTHRRKERYDQRDNDLINRASHRSDNHNERVTDRRRDAHKEGRDKRVAAESQSHRFQQRDVSEDVVEDRRSRHAAAKFSDSRRAHRAESSEDEDMYASEATSQRPGSSKIFASRGQLGHAEKMLMDIARDMRSNRSARRSPSPIKSSRGRSPMRRGYVDDSPSPVASGAPLQNASGKYKNPAVYTDGKDHSPSWDIEDKDAELFSTDEDREERKKGKERAEPSVSASDKGDASNIAPDKQDESSFKLEDYEDDDLPPLAYCEMRSTFNPSTGASYSINFLHPVAFVPDMQMEELSLINSLHNFEFSIPYANIAVCKPYSFSLEMHTNRLIWNAEFVNREEPSMKSVRPRNVVGLMLGVVKNANLKKAVNLSVTGKNTYMSRRIGIMPSEMSLKRMVRLMGTKLQWPAVKVSLDNSCIVNFSVRGQTSAPATPSSGRYSRPPQNKSTDPSKDVRGVGLGFYPSVLDFTTEVKVYDARGTDFVFDKEHLDKVHSLPEFSTFTEDSELNERCVVAVAYTLNAYGVPSEKPADPTDFKDCPTLSTNVQFVIVLGLLPASAYDY